MQCKMHKVILIDQRISNSVEAACNSLPIKFRTFVLWHMDVHYDSKIDLCECLLILKKSYYHKARFSQLSNICKQSSLGNFDDARKIFFNTDSIIEQEFFILSSSEQAWYELRLITQGYFINPLKNQVTWWLTLYNRPIHE